MSRYADAQYELVYAVIEDIAEERGLTPGEAEALTSRVFAEDRLWSPEIWCPVRDFVSDIADGI